MKTRVVVGCFLMLALNMHVIAGDCVKDQYGSVVCGKGQCATDQYGKVLCAKEGGGAIRIEMESSSVGWDFARRTI